jgi:beta-galactosidase/beta-glucuronidase
VTDAAVPTPPRADYPRPTAVRERWLCLNGEWEFELDPGDSGLERGLLTGELGRSITVPFCMESLLSGVGIEDFVAAVWYARTVEVPADWAGNRVLLHFQAVDHDTTVWVNGQQVTRHRGGFTPFSADITAVAPPGSSARIMVRARDDHRRGNAKGKQSARYRGYACFYTRTTGVWQPVWMEPVPVTALTRPRVTPDVAGSRFVVEVPLDGPRAGLTTRATLRDADGVVVTTQGRGPLVLDIPADRVRLWDLDDPHLYELTLELTDAGGHVVDVLDSYAGLRSIEVDGPAVLLNGRSVFQRLVLDQGYYPDGVLTAPTDDDLLRDIQLAKAAGFNGARLHQKVFEERYLFHADREGFLVWGEMPDWGVSVDGPEGDRVQHGTTFVAQWLEALERDYSHPSIVGWCALNETVQEIGDRLQALDDVTRACVLAVRAADRTRPVLDASGYSHREPSTDIWDSHDYEQDVEVFTANHAGTASGKPYVNEPMGIAVSVDYAGQPVMVSEFGGIWWNAARTHGDDSWGYGAPPADVEELHQRFEGLSAALLNNPGVFGYCYTQLTDVFQEQNGVYAFDRTPKLDIERVRRAQSAVAAIELRESAR